MEWRRGNSRPRFCQPLSATGENDLVSRKTSFKRAAPKNFFGAQGKTSAVIECDESMAEMMRAFDAGSRAGGCRSRFTAHAVAMLNLLRQPILPVLRDANCLCGSRSGWYALCLFERGRASAATGVVWHLNVRMRPFLSCLAFNLRFYGQRISNQVQLRRRP